MITAAQITVSPMSGIYNEKVYDAPISTEKWTWVKIEINQFDTFYGQFKGAPIQIALSTKNPYFYVLTDSLLYEIDRENPSHYNVRDYYDAGRSLSNVTLTPSGELLLSDYYNIFKLTAPLCKINGDLNDTLIEIENHYHIVDPEFKSWHNHQLHIQAAIFGSNEMIELYYDSISNQFSKVEIKNR